MATHSSVLAWRIPGTGEPGGLLSMGSHRVRHDWSDLAVAAACALSMLALYFITTISTTIQNFVFTILFINLCMPNQIYYLIFIFFIKKILCTVFWSLLSLNIVILSLSLSSVAAVPPFLPYELFYWWRLSPFFTIKNRITTDFLVHVFLCKSQKGIARSWYVNIQLYKRMRDCFPVCL